MCDVVMGGGGAAALVRWLTICKQTNVTMLLSSFVLCFLLSH